MKRKDEYSVGSIFLIVALEEVFARWFCIGVLTKIPFLTGTTAFFVLMILGNMIWAAVHVTNFQDEDEQQFFRVLPQFVGGFLYAFLYVKYGLFVTILAHFTFDAVLFSAGKCNDLDLKDLFYILYYGVMLLVAGLSMKGLGLNLADLKPWLGTTALSPLEGYNFLDYLVVLFFVECILDFVASLLFMDRTNPEELDDDQPPLWKVYVFGPLFLVLFVYIINWVLGFFTANIFLQVLAVALFFVVMATHTSMSAVSRAWLVGLPQVFLFIAVILTLGFWASIGLVFLSMLISLPVEIMKRLD